MKSGRAGALAAAAGLVILALGVGPLRAQESNDDGTMRAPTVNRDGPFGRSIVPGVQILTVGEGGTYIILRDNTVWEVYLPDRTSTVGWREQDFLVVKQAPVGHGNYTYELINGRTEETAIVRFEGRTG
jgi:hypothetical protein